MIYLYVFIILLLFSWLEIKGLFSKSQRKLQLLIAIIFTIIAGLRYETGVDWAGYEYYFNRIPSFETAFASNNYKPIFFTLDVGYALFNSIVKMFGGNIQMIFILISLLSNFLLLKNLRKNTKFVITGYFIYYSFFFFTYDMSGLRQGLAIQIIFYAYQFIEKRNLKKYVLFILLAGSVHWTAYLLILLYFFINKNVSKYSFLIIPICLILFTLQIEVITKIIPDINVLIKGNELLSGKLTAYSTNETFSQARTWDVFAIFNGARILLLFLLIKRIKKSDTHVNLYLNLLLVEFICYFGLYELNEVSERLRFYFTISEIILIPILIYRAKTYVYKDLLFVIIIGLTAFSCVPFILQFPSTVAYHPYQNYIIYKVFDKKSTGPERLKKHAETH